MATAAVTLTVPTLAAAAPGELDTGFGVGGVSVVFAGGPRTNSEATAVALDAVGNIIVAGDSTPFGELFAPQPPTLSVSRLTPTGAADTSFGTGGSAVFPLGDYPTARAVVAQSDGSILVLANVTAMASDGSTMDQLSYVVRLTSKGALDTSFGTGGMARLAPSGTTSGSGLAVSAGGTIVASGATSPALGGVPWAFVERLTSSGSPDEAFGTDGITTLPAAGDAAAVASDLSGRVFTGVITDSWMTANPVAETFPGLRTSFSLWRLTATGTVDATYGHGGGTTLALPPATTVRTVLAEPDGSVVTVGGLGGHPLVARFTASGSPDPTFGRGGVVDISLPGGAHTDDLGGALEPSGDIVISGPGGPTGVFVTRLASTGAPDRNFAPGGWSTPLLNALGPVIPQTGPALQGDGGVVLAGRAPGVSLPDGTIDGDQTAVLRVLGGTAASTPAPNTVSRLAGSDRIATSVAVSQATFADRSHQERGRVQAGGILLASADNFPDALVAVPYAGYIHAPVLLTPGGTLDPRVLAEIRRVLGDPTQGGTVTVVGGTAAISDGAEEAVRTAGYAVERIAGADRYETAALMADQMGAGIVLETSGTNFPDAVAAGAAAAHVAGAVLLTNGSAQAPATTAYINASGAVRYAVGGPAAIADPIATPLFGPDRYATAASVASTFFPTPSAAEVATGATFADALSGGSRAAIIGAPVLLTDPSVLPSPAMGWLQGAAAWVDFADVIGGSAAVGDSVLASVQHSVS